MTTTSPTELGRVSSRVLPSSHSSSSSSTLDGCEDDGRCDEIGAEGLHVERRVADGLRGVDHGDGADGASAAAEFRGGVDRAEGVRNMREREELHLRREELVECREVEPALAVGS